MGNSYTITFAIAAFYLFNVFLFSIAFVLPNAINPFDAFDSVLGIQPGTFSGTPGSGTSNKQDPELVRQNKAVQQACGAGAIGGAITGAVIGTALLPGVGTLVGGAVGALAGGYIGCQIAQSNPSGTADFFQGLANSIPGLGTIGDLASVIGSMVQWVNAFLAFGGEIAGFGFLLFGVDPIIGTYMASLNSLFIFWFGFLAINMFRGRGG